MVDMDGAVGTYLPACEEEKGSRTSVSYLTQPVRVGGIHGNTSWRGAEPSVHHRSFHSIFPLPSLELILINSSASRKVFGSVFSRDTHHCLLSSLESGKSLFFLVCNPRIASS